jgi:2-oxoglutarate ferredoxin oxidoreductase subunit alpha
MALRLVMGNEAVVQGALAAGCDFYAGYPITPATEIMEEMARALPPRGGVFLQMEDELAALAAAIGAAWGGARAMTATSGPGFSLMQEHIGYAAMTQTPVVVVDAQRGGPSTGLPTLPAQGDVMQARFGSHGDRPAVVLTASSVAEAYAVMAKAFRLAFRHRLPVIVLLDAVIAHMREPVDLPDLPAPKAAAFPELREGDARFGAAPFVPFGEGPITVVTGLSHGFDGLPHTGSGREQEEILRASMERVAQDPELVEGVHTVQMEDARVAVVAYGITARAAREAVDLLRADGVAAGLVALDVLWPLPVAALRQAARHVDLLIVAELNLGQLVMPIQAAVADLVPVFWQGRADGRLLDPSEIREAVLARWRLRGKGGRHAPARN